MPEIAPFSLRGKWIADRYHIDEVIGQGGYATVYRAERVEGGAVALKILDARHRHGRRALNRFRREATLLRRVRHPGVVTPLDAGMCRVGPYIAFELLQGRSLREALRAGRRFSASETALIGIELCAALEAAHAAGVIHRDIKPDNLFLCDEGSAKILDFGVAKALADDDGDATALTMRGEMTGTIPYAPPEQLGSDRFGPWSDLFSLGLVMAEMLTGKRVCEGDDVVDQCMDRLSAEPIALEDDVLASPLGPVILQATQKPERDRYQSAALMQRAIEQACLPRHSLVRQRERDSSTQDAPSSWVSACCRAGRSGGPCPPRDGCAATRRDGLARPAHRRG